MVKMLRKDVLEFALNRLPHSQHQGYSTNLIQPSADLFGIPMVALDIKWTSRGNRKEVIHASNFDQFIDQLFDLSFVLGVKSADFRLSKNAIKKTHCGSFLVVYYTGFQEK